MNKIIFLILVIFSLDAIASLFGPSNFDECVSEGKRRRTNQELSLHMDLCSSKFPRVPSIFNQSDKFVLCRFTADRRYGFNIKLNKDNASEISDYKNFKFGKITVKDKEHVEILFPSDNGKGAMLIDINNLGSFILANNIGKYFGLCSER